VVQIFGKSKFLQKLEKTILKKANSDEKEGSDGTIPLMTPEMITPKDKPVSAKRAVQVYKKYMLQVGYLDKTDLEDFSRSLKENMAEWEKDLKFDIQSAKELVAEAKAEVKEAKKHFSQGKDDEDREFARKELDTAQAELDEETAAYELLKQKLAYFKKDKRGFLLNYINSEIHGDNWGK
jgi:vacuolar-type H+-ATPase subunit I/STV1